MKKRKFSWLLNVATICLCVCAIAIGVYSATTASLTVSGTIGFNAHNVKAGVTLSVKGDAVTSSTTDGTTTYTPNANGTISRAEYAQLGDTLTINDKNQTAEHSLSWTDKIYFCDLANNEDAPSDIYLKISITNNSDYPIMASFASAPTITGVTVSIADGSSSYVKVANGTTGNTGDIVLKLSVTKDSTTGEYPEITATNNVNFSMKLEKYDDFFVDKVSEREVDSSGTIATDWTTTNRLCTYLGHGTTTDKAEFEVLRWYAFAVRGEKTSDNNYTTYPSEIFKKQSIAGVAITEENVTKIQNSYTSGSTTINETWYSLTGVDMSKVNYKGYTFWFIQEYVVAGGYKDANGNDISGKVFNSDSSQNYSNIYKNDNYTSEIYSYINGAGATNYQAQTGITYDNTLTISDRAVTDTDTETNRSSLSNTFTSKYWLINSFELGLLANTSISNSDYNYYNHILTYGIGNKAGPKSRFGARWWLRSPISEYNSHARMVASDGYFGNLLVNGSGGVRAAFQIGIAG